MRNRTVFGGGERSLGGSSSTARTIILHVWYHWRAEVGAGVATAPGFQPGASNDPVFRKSVGKCLKMQKTERKGYDAGYPGYGRGMCMFFDILPVL